MQKKRKTELTQCGAIPVSRETVKPLLRCRCAHDPFDRFTGGREGVPDPLQAYPVYRGTNALEAVCDVLVRGDVTALLAKGNTNLQTSTYL